MFSEIVLHDFKRPMRDRLVSRKFCGPYHWSPSTAGKGRGFYSSQGNALVMDHAGSSLDLRLEWANDHLSHYSRLRHIEGYFCDGDTLKPIIARLPHGRGYLAGWTMGAGMCGSLDPEIYNDPEDAARAAHDIADRDAEREREIWEDDFDDDA